MVQQIAEKQRAGAFFGTGIADRKQPGEAAIGLPIHRIGKNIGRAIGEDQPGAGDHSKIILRRNAQFGIGIGSDHPGERITVGDADPHEAGGMGLHDQFFGMRGSAQKAEIGRHGQFGEADRVWRAHAGSAEQAMDIPARPGLHDE